MAFQLVDYGLANTYSGHSPLERNPPLSHYCHIDSVCYEHDLIRPALCIKNR